MGGERCARGAGQPESHDRDCFRRPCIWLHLLDRLFILLTLICNWVDQQLFFLEGVIRIINKVKWRVWTTYSCALRAVTSPGPPSAPSLKNPFSNNRYVASQAPMES